MISTLSNLLLLSSLTSGNYTIQNQNNIFNLLIAIISRANEQERKRILEDIKLLVGMTFYESFKIYIQKKFAIDHELVILMCR